MIMLLTYLNSKKEQVWRSEASEIWGWHLGWMWVGDSNLKVIWTRGLFLFNKLLLCSLQFIKSRQAYKYKEKENLNFDFVFAF